MLVALAVDNSQFEGKRSFLIGIESVCPSIKIGFWNLPKETDILSPACSVVLNAIKELSKIPDDIKLISPNVLEPMLQMKKSLGSEQEKLHLTEVLTALSICSTTNPMAEKALNNLTKLRGCEAHATYMVENGDKKALKQLKINLTCEPKFATDVELETQ
jgi:uncharacterized protein (UPF0371 family)